MGNVASATIGLYGQTEQYERSMNRASYIAKLTAQQIAGAFKEKLDQVDSHVRKTGDGFELSFNRIKGLAAGAAAALGVLGASEVLKQADQYQQLEARIRNVTTTTGDFARVNEELFAISQKNGVSFEATAQTFGNLVRAGREFGATNEQVLKVTAAIQQLGVISGASGESMKAALLQFGQALASGRLQGDELRSIMENMPELATRIASGLGVARGELKQLGAEGKLTAEGVFAALLKQTEDINKEFASMPASMERAMTSAQNSVGRFIGEADTLTGTTKIIAENIAGWSKALDDATVRMKAFGDDMVRIGDRQVKRSTAIRATLEEMLARIGDPIVHSGALSGILTPLARPDIEASIARRTQKIEEQNKALAKQAEHKAAVGHHDEKAAKAAAKQADHYRDLVKSMAQGNLELKLALEGEDQKVAISHALAQAEDKVGRALTASEKSRITQLAVEKQLLEGSQKRFEEEQKHAKALAEKHKNTLAESLTLNDATKAEIAAKELEYNRALTELNERRTRQSEKLIQNLEREVRAQELANKGKEREAEWLQVLDQLNENKNEKTEQQIEKARRLFDQQTEQLRAAKQQSDLMQQAQDALNQHMERSKQIATTLGQSLQTAFESAIFSGQGFGSVLRGLAVDIERMILRLTVLQPLQNAIMNAATGGLGGIVGRAVGFVGNIFRGGSAGGPAPLATINGALPVPVPGFASGGFRPAGQLSMVGENGPELEVSGSPTTVLPNSLLGQLGGNTEVNVYIENKTNANARVEERQNASGGRDIFVEISEQVAQDIRRGGTVGRAIKDTFGTNRSGPLR